MSKILTDAERAFFEAMQEAVTKQPRDYRYPGWYNGTCNYLTYSDVMEPHTRGQVPTGPACLIGQGLLNSGQMDMESLMAQEGTAAGQIVPHSYEVTQVAARMQMLQDNGESWRTAYLAGIAMLDGMGYDTWGLELPQVHE